MEALGRDRLLVGDDRRQLPRQQRGRADGPASPRVGYPGMGARAVGSEQRADVAAADPAGHGVVHPPPSVPVGRVGAPGAALFRRQPGGLRGARAGHGRAARIRVRQRGHGLRLRPLGARAVLRVPEGHPQLRLHRVDHGGLSRPVATLAGRGQPAVRAGRRPGAGAGRAPGAFPGAQARPRIPGRRRRHRMAAGRRQLRQPAGTRP